ncbi:DUF429 domain-containing protein [Acidisoma cellulosilytica]|uniref:DUF429 domain-containing protein n=1 Tax=Acidisoma cellulosilyticum TaxID=2802395 RepID=A0A963YZ24_9PROT|nr:DUF429 domain-containing protein [Acidisoma cellulosilyticum]MCB8879832.1 DUF429 domain-containing protein [Acidisoma cellulosilyticum]
MLSLLREGVFEAAAIDAPFALPTRFMPLGGHAELLDRVRALPSADDRPFPSGASLLELAARIAPIDQKKPHRETERRWTQRGINTRSTLWNGPRGGAPFTVACLTLLARSERPVWPWHDGQGMLVEAFPAAQLHSWNLPSSGYSKPEQQEMRERILVGLAEFLSFTATQYEEMSRSPDALDATVAAFAAIAAAQHGRPAEYPIDGLIAVMNQYGSLDL